MPSKVNNRRYAEIYSLVLLLFVLFFSASLGVSASVGCWIFTACHEPPQLFAVPPPLVLHPVAVPPLAHVTLYDPPSHKTAAAGPIDESSAIAICRARELNLFILNIPYP
jgi:hypothetical protein